MAHWNRKSLPALKNHYSRDEDRKDRDHQHFLLVANDLIHFVAAIVSPERSLGWSPDVATSIDKFLSSDEAVYGTIRRWMEKKGLMNSGPREPLWLDRWQIEVTAFEFGTWAPNAQEFTRGEYFRHLWRKVYEKVPTTRPETEVSIMTSA